MTAQAEDLEKIVNPTIGIIIAPLQRDSLRDDPSYVFIYGIGFTNHYMLHHPDGAIVMPDSELIIANQMVSNYRSAYSTHGQSDPGREHPRTSSSGVDFLGKLGRADLPPNTSSPPSMTDREMMPPAPRYYISGRQKQRQHDYL